jgi:sortase (surface protein transpeptidase)
MAGQHSWSRIVKFYAKAISVYGLMVVFIWLAVRPVDSLAHTRTVSITKSPTSQFVAMPKITLVSGIPDQIVIPSESVNLPVDEAYYNPTSATWTLSGYRTQFLMSSAPANNVGGETFIYGHNNDYVFGALRHHTPAVGATALVYTTNGHILSYIFESVRSVGPNDVAVLNYQGPPILLIQTCTGSLNEWRTMYKFDFYKVIQ